MLEYLVRNDLLPPNRSTERLLADSSYPFPFLIFETPMYQEPLPYNPMAIYRISEYHQSYRFLSYSGEEYLKENRQVYPIHRTFAQALPSYLGYD